MSTIASPRDLSGPRRMTPGSTGGGGPAGSSLNNITPTSSTRPSLDVPRSASSSPNPNNHGTTPALPATTTTSTNKRANRAALREYYNLKKTISGASTPTLEISDHPDSSSSIPQTSTLTSELDAPDFDAQAYIAKALEGSTLAELLGTYARVLGEIRALDAEKKALVYDNYSKLISATETIRKMRANMEGGGQQDSLTGGGLNKGGLDPTASAALDAVIACVYERASGIREEVRRGLNPSASESGEPVSGAEDDARRARKARTRELVVEVMAVPERLRGLMRQGKEEEARREWEMPRRLLERWKEKGFGGSDVDALLEEGDGILRGGGGGESRAASTERSSVTT